MPADELIYKGVLAVLGTRAATELGMELYNEVFKSRQIAQQAASIEKLAAEELSKPTFNTNADSGSEAGRELTRELDALRLNPGRFGDVVNKIESDRSADPHIPKLILSNDVDNHGLVGAISFRNGSADSTGVSGKQVAFPLTQEMNQRLEVRVALATQNKMELLLPEKFVAASQPIYSVLPTAPKGKMWKAQ